MEIEPDRTWTARKRDRFVLRALCRRFGEERVRSSGLSVLDLGCGTGNLAEALGQAGLAGVFGLDLDREAIAQARLRCGRYGHRFEVGAVEAFDSPPLYDAVVLSDVLVCLRDPEVALQSARRWVQPGGLVLVTAANGFGPWACYRWWVERRAGIERGPESALGRHRFSAGRLASLVLRAGFRIEAWERSSFLSAVYPFSVSRYRPRRFGFLERWDLAVADLLPRALASGWYLSLIPSRLPARAARPAPRRAAVTVGRS